LKQSDAILLTHHRQSVNVDIID